LGHFQALFFLLLVVFFASLLLPKEQRTPTTTSYFSQQQQNNNMAAVWGMGHHVLQSALLLVLLGTLKSTAANHGSENDRNNDKWMRWFEPNDDKPNQVNDDRCYSSKQEQQQ
jgi:hypothetical protein